MKYCEKYQTVTQRPEVNKCWKNGTEKLAPHRLATNSQLKIKNKNNEVSIKHNKVKCNKHMPVYYPNFMLDNIIIIIS